MIQGSATASSVRSVSAGWTGEIVRFVGRSRLNATASLLVCGAIALAALAAFGQSFDIVVTPYDPLSPNLRARLQPPSETHWFGTDQLGRDLFSRVAVGTLVSVQVALSVLAIAVVIGLFVGILAGLVGGIVDDVLMRIADIFLAFPLLILAAAISASLGGGLFTTTIALSMVFWPWYARMARARVLALKSSPFITASISMGASRWRLMTWSLLPLVWPSVAVQAASDAGFVMLATAGLSFLGLGAQPPTPEWGSMIFGSLSYQPTSWWLALFPGLALAVTTFGFNLLGDGIRDHLDPSMVDPPG